MDRNQGREHDHKYYPISTAGSAPIQLVCFFRVWRHFIMVWFTSLLTSLLANRTSLGNSKQKKQQ